MLPHFLAVAFLSQNASLVHSEPVMSLKLSFIPESYGA